MSTWEMQCRQCDGAVAYAPPLGGTGGYGDRIAWVCWKCEALFCGRCVSGHALAAARASADPYSAMRDAVEFPCCPECGAEIELAREWAIRAHVKLAEPAPVKMAFAGALMGAFLGLIAASWLDAPLSLGAGAGAVVGSIGCLILELRSTRASRA